MRRTPTSRWTRALNDHRLIGVAILVLAGVVLFLSYSAQSGLPWEPSYSIKAQVPDAAKLPRNADVRIGGARVGQVLTIEAAPRKGSVPPHAVLGVKLDAAAGPLPADTTAEVRVGSVLGSKYLALVPGNSRRDIPEDGTLPLRNASVSVDVDEAFKVFDPEGRARLRQSVTDFAEATAGRGAAINETIGESAHLLPPFQRVLRTFNDPRSDLRGFVTGVASATRAFGPVSNELAGMVGGAARTFGALDRDTFGESIGELPSTADAATRALRDVRPALDDAAEISRELRPAADALPGAAEQIDRTARTAIRVDPKIGKLAQPLNNTLKSTRSFADSPSSTDSLKLLGGDDLATFGASAFVGLGAILSTVWDAERYCRVATKWVSHQRDIVRDGDAGGHWLRMIPMFDESQTIPRAAPAPNLHANPYPRADAQECEAGNEGYVDEQLIGNPPGNQGRPEGGG